MRREEAEVFLAVLLGPGFLPREEAWGDTTRDIAAEVEEGCVRSEDGDWVVVLRFGMGRYRYEHWHRHLLLSNGQPANVEAVAREILDCVLVEPHGDGSYRGRPFDRTRDGRMLRTDSESGDGPHPFSPEPRSARPETRPAAFKAVAVAALATGQPQRPGVEAGPAQSKPRRALRLPVAAAHLRLGAHRRERRPARDPGQARTRVHRRVSGGGARRRLRAADGWLHLPAGRLPGPPLRSTVLASVIRTCAQRWATELPKGAADGRVIE